MRQTSPSYLSFLPQQGALIVMMPQMPQNLSLLGNTSFKKEWFLSGIAQIISFPPPPLLSGNLYIFFGRQKGIYKVYFLIRARPSPPPHSGNARKKTFFLKEVFPYLSLTIIHVDNSLTLDILLTCLPFST